MRVKTSWLGRAFGVHALAAAIVWVCLISAASADGLNTYWTHDPNTHGIKTFTWASGRSGTFTSQVGEQQTIAFGNGETFTARWITNAVYGLGDDTVDLLMYMDANYAQVLALEGHYIAEDPNMFAPASGGRYGPSTDGDIVAQGGFYVIPMNGDPPLHETNSGIHILYDFQDVTVPYGTYANCMIEWQLDEAHDFTALSLLGMDANLDIALPTGADTNGWAVEGISITAPGFGKIADGSIDAESGTLQEMNWLTGWEPVPEPATMALLAMGGLALLRRGRKQPDLKPSRITAGSR